MGETSSGRPIYIVNSGQSPVCLVTRGYLGRVVFAKNGQKGGFTEIRGYLRILVKRSKKWVFSDF